MSIMHPRPLRIVLMAVAFLVASVTWADPPSEVARLGYLTGAVSFSPSGEAEWVRASGNRPLISGDRLWVPAASLAELQTAGATIGMASFTRLNLLNIVDDVAQVELIQGTINVRVRDPAQMVEVATPNLALTLRRPGSYRISVDPADDATTVSVRGGQGEVYGDGAAYIVNSRETYRFYGIGLDDFDVLGQPVVDQFDRWTRDRERRLEASVSARYVARGVIGYEDLDIHGVWRNVPAYGPAWFPQRVSANWSPYSEGHWSWIEPWGWTWIDEAPWGFAVSHYGRWANVNGAWCWVPGPQRERAVYAPALVAFVGGGQFQMRVASGNVGAVAWFPLSPLEVYRPAYPVSRDYFARVNRSNTVINNTVIINSYQTSVTNVTYVNQRVPGAVVAVPQTTFVLAQPVSRASMRLDAQQLAYAPIASVAAVAPIQRSVIGAAAIAPRPDIETERPVIVRATPPPQLPAFASRQMQLTISPGMPLAPAEVQRTRPSMDPAPSAAPPRVILTPQTVPTQPMANVQRTAPSSPSDAPAGDRGRGSYSPGLERMTPPSVTPGAASVPAMPPAQRGRSDIPGQIPGSPGAPWSPQPDPAASSGRPLPPPVPGTPPAMRTPPPSAAPERVSVPEQRGPQIERRVSPQDIQQAGPRIQSQPVPASAPQVDPRSPQRARPPEPVSVPSAALEPAQRSPVAGPANPPAVSRAPGSAPPSVPAETRAFEGRGRSQQPEQPSAAPPPAPADMRTPPIQRERPAPPPQPAAPGSPVPPPAPIGVAPPQRGPQPGAEQLQPQRGPQPGSEQFQPQRAVPGRVDDTRTPEEIRREEERKGRRIPQ